MSVTAGMDPDSVDVLARDLAGAAQQLRAVEQRVGTQLRSAPWAGRDVEALRGEWTGQHARSVTTAAGALETASTVAAANAADQRQASQATGGTLLGGSLLGGSLLGGTLGGGLAGGAVAGAGHVDGLLGVALPGGAIAGGALTAGIGADASQAWDNFVRWANTPQELPNSGLITSPLNVAYGLHQVDSGAIIFVSGGLEDATGIGALLGIPSNIYGGYLIFAGSARVFRGADQFVEVQKHPTVVETPLEYGKHIAQGVLPGGNLIGILGGLPG